MERFFTKPRSISRRPEDKLNSWHKVESCACFLDWDGSMVPDLYWETTPSSRYWFLILSSTYLCFLTFNRSIKYIGSVARRPYTQSQDASHTKQKGNFKQSNSQSPSSVILSFLSSTQEELCNMLVRGEKRETARSVAAWGRCVLWLLFVGDAGNNTQVLEWSAVVLQYHGTLDVYIHACTTVLRQLLYSFSPSLETEGG